MADTDDSAAIDKAWTALESALRPRAPRLLADLGGPASAEALASVAPELAALYRRHDGQRGEHRLPIFKHAFFLPLRGPESVESENTAHAGQASRGFLRFTKDYAGSWHGLVVDAATGFKVGGIVFKDSDAARPKRVAASLATFLTAAAAEIAGGKRHVDDRREQVLTVSFPFGGARPRRIDDPALAQAGIELTVIDTSRATWQPSPFPAEPFPPPSQGIFVRCAEPAKIAEMALVFDGDEFQAERGSGPIMIDGEMFVGNHYAAASGLLSPSSQGRVQVRVAIRLLV